MIEPVHVGIQAALQGLGADRMVNPVDSPLRVAPEPLDVVRVRPSRDVLLGAVNHDFMGIPQAG